MTSILLSMGTAGLCAADNTQVPALTPAPTDAAQLTLEHLRAAHQARATRASEDAAWTAERTRLQALIDATKADTKRLRDDASAADQRRAASQAQLAALAETPLAQAQQQLRDHSTRYAAQLTTLSHNVPPGVIPPLNASTNDGGFDQVIRALDSAERAASSVAVEIVTGSYHGKTQAVKMLRIAGAAAWWLAFDGKNAGTVHLDNGTVVLQDVSAPDLSAIVNAFAQAEQRQPASVVWLPITSPLTLAPSTTGAQP